MSRPTRHARLIVYTIGSCQAVKRFSANTPHPDVDRHAYKYRPRVSVSARKIGSRRGPRTRSLLTRNKEGRHVASFRLRTRIRHQRYDDRRRSQRGRGASSDDTRLRRCRRLFHAFELAKGNERGPKSCANRWAFADPHMEADFEFAEANNGPERGGRAAHIKSAGHRHHSKVG
jgi:hypothetical protein